MACLHGEELTGSSIQRGYDECGAPPDRRRRRPRDLLPGSRSRRRPGDRPAARLPDQFVHVPRTHPVAGRQLPRHRAGPPWLRPLGGPLAGEFTYTFDALADLTGKLLDQLGLDRYALYVQDYGAPIGWRLALRRPDRISALVTQNGNGYEDGFVESFWTDVWAYGANPGPDTEPAVRAALGIDAIRWQYLHGVPDPSRVSPDTWQHDFALVSRPNNDEVQLALFRDYQNNRPLYPLLHEFLRTSEVPVLAVWGRNDEIFGPAGAQAFTRDAKDAEVHLINGGHFLLESHLDVVTGYLRGFLGRVLG